MATGGRTASGLRGAWRRMVPWDLRMELVRRKAELGSLGQVRRNQAMLASRLAELERELPRASTRAPVEDPRFPPQVRSRVCTQAQLEEPWFAAWCEEFGEPPIAHRKLWEFAYIAEVLQATGMLAPGRRGLGFGVGQEPLPSAFASRGVEVVATDIDPEAREARGWIQAAQHANDNLGALLRPGVCDPETFHRLVSWRPADMRAIPDDLRGFDFCWSACALEHLGSLPAGLEFVEQSLRTLAPGGIAVHTTEYNLSSDDDTIEGGPCVVYRARDIRAAVERLEAAGNEVAALDLYPGDGVLDQYVDVPPYNHDPCLRFLLGRYTLTSVALVIRTPS